MSKEKYYLYLNGLDFDKIEEYETEEINILKSRITDILNGKENVTIDRLVLGKRINIKPIICNVKIDL